MRVINLMLFFITMLFILASCSDNVSYSQEYWLQQYSTDLRESTIRQFLNNTKQDKQSALFGNYMGIYVTDSVQQFRLALVGGDDEKYYLIYLDGGDARFWKEGDVKAELNLTSVPGKFVGSWRSQGKKYSYGVRINFYMEGSFNAEVNWGANPWECDRYNFSRVYPNK